MNARHFTGNPYPQVVTAATNPLAQQVLAAAYARYVEACHAEECEAHTRHLWEMHGCPSGPLG